MEAGWGFGMMEIIIREQRNIDYAIKQLTEIDLSKPHVVKISEFKRTRSTAQNSLLWKWLTVIGNSVGLTKDELHLQFKSQYLMPIVLRDDLDDYAIDVHNKIRAMWAGDAKDEASMIKRLLVNYISTSWLNVKQFTEYLHEIEGYARDGKIALPYPDEYNQAMGIKS
jgi:hypothetical protein